MGAIKVSRSKRTILEGKKGGKLQSEESENEECKKIGQTVQGDFQHDQRRFWAKMKSSVRGTRKREKCVMKADRCCVRRKRLVEGGNSTCTAYRTGMGMKKRYRQRRVGMSRLVWKKYAVVYRD